MGQEIATSQFDEADRKIFAARLAAETAHLRALACAGGLSGAGPVAGFELEAWLIDRNMFPAPHNQDFLARLNEPLVVAELSRFNIELNGTPRSPGGTGLLEMEQELAGTWAKCLRAAHDQVDTAIAIGTLPTLRDADLSLRNMTPSNRYAALNREGMRLRGGAAVEVDIDCADPAGRHLKSRHRDVMLEAGTTSFQLHLQVPIAELGAAFDAALELCGPLLALAANSPFLFGQPLWHETRIALFEQAMNGAGSGPGMRPRVFLGDRLAGDDPLAILEDNLDDYPVLLPLLSDTPVERYAHLRLHNGTLWRWVRPLVGFDEDGTAHLRLEQRVMPAGPSVIDMFANAAFFYGAVHALARQPAQGSLQTIRANFYAAARLGMGCELIWNGALHPARTVLKALLPLARQGLEQLGADAAVIDRYLDVIEQRIAAGRTGAGWQLAHFARHGDLFRLTADYLEHQRSGMAVHEWPI
ncbi:MAG: glutamate-cysteine ligase family protein [Novosphingobium sp.]